MILEYYNQRSAIEHPKHSRFFLFSMLKIIMISTYLSFIKTYFSKLPQRMLSEFIYGLSFIDVSITTILFIGYFTLSYYLLNGQTVGKILFNLKVVPNHFFKYPHHMEIKKMGLWSSLQRAVGTFLCYMSLGTLYYVNFLRKDGRGIADFLSHSVTLTEHEVFEEIDLRSGIIYADRYSYAPFALPAPASKSEHIIEIDFVEQPNKKSAA